MHSFIAYIDESGDDGFGNYRGASVGGGASEWLGITALVIRANREHELVSWRDDVKATVGKNTLGRHIHFKDFDHGQRKAACMNLADKPFRFISTFAHKPSLSQSNFAGKNQLYFYVTRYVIERISWICRDMRPKVREGNGSVKIIFSRRGGMSYNDFKRYLEDIKRATTSSSIHWPVIDVNAIEAIDHKNNSGLQISDCVCSATFAALQKDRYGNVERQYFDSLRKQVYTHKGKSINYGLKFLPSVDEISANYDLSHMLEGFG